MRKSQSLRFGPGSQGLLVSSRPNSGARLDENSTVSRWQGLPLPALRHHCLASAAGHDAPNSLLVADSTAILILSPANENPPPATV
jgi:hypothetical protein